MPKTPAIDTRSWTMGYYPTPARPAPTDAELVARLRLFNHNAEADRMESLIAEVSLLRWQRDNTGASPDQPLA